ncbi:MAG: adenosine deaminase [Burkholderiaceae bacterium]|nr:adenosine deaminase [Burkholderiaceae bacterium]
MHHALPKWICAATLAFALAAHAGAAPATSNEETTRRYFASLVTGAEPKLAELTQFFTMMPKGGDLHHHYSGAIYAEQFLEWAERQRYCIDKTSYRIVTERAQIEAEAAKPLEQRGCLAVPDAVRDENVYRGLLQHWSDKDFADHGALQPPPDQQFFDTFGYFWPVASLNHNEGLQLLKRRAQQENLLYIETIFEMPPLAHDADFDTRAWRHDADLDALFTAKAAALKQDAPFLRRIDDYVADVEAANAGIDDANFSMRYQAYVLRLLPPSDVFSSMLAGFEAASRSKLIVGVNIVGAENDYVAMRDYTLHMRMFHFLKARYPKVKVALHAGELALGMVPPEGLTFHIKEALDTGGADRIGHGMDLAHETDSAGIMEEMRKRDIPVEVNLSSNAFILGVQGQAHPVTLYRKFGVPFVLATDDAGVSRNNLSGEYVLFASRYHSDYAEIKKLSYAGLRYAFLNEDDKQRMLKELDARFARFEAQITAMSAHAVPGK